MRTILSAAVLLLLAATTGPAEARGRNSDRIYTTTYPRCGTYGCVARHERAARVGGRERGFRDRSFRATGARSRY